MYGFYGEVKKHSKYKSLWISCLVVVMIIILLITFNIIHNKFKICQKSKKNTNKECELKLNSFKYIDNYSIEKETIYSIEKSSCLSRSIGKLKNNFVRINKFF